MVRWVGTVWVSLVIDHDSKKQFHPNEICRILSSQKENEYHRSIVFRPLACTLVVGWKLLVSVPLLACLAVSFPRGVSVLRPRACACVRVCGCVFVLYCIVCVFHEDRRCAEVLCGCVFLLACRSSTPAKKRKRYKLLHTTSLLLRWCWLWSSSSWRKKEEKSSPKRRWQVWCVYVWTWTKMTVFTWSQAGGRPASTSSFSTVKLAKHGRATVRNQHRLCACVRACVFFPVLCFGACLLVRVSACISVEDCSRRVILCKGRIGVCIIVNWYILARSPREQTFSDLMSLSWFLQWAQIRNCFALVYILLWFQLC